MHIAVHLNTRDIPCWRFQPRHRAQLQAALPEATLAVCHDSDSFVEALKTADIALVWRFTQAWLDSAPALTWIATPAAGRDYFELTPRENLTLTYGTFHGELMGETVLAMLLAQCRGVIDAVRLQGTHQWPRENLAATMRPLRGSHLVILGFGRIGAWIGRLAKGFGVRLTGIRRQAATPPDYFDGADRVVGPDALDTVLPTADHLVLALPGGAETTHMLDERRLALLPVHAVVYNVGRGNAIDEAALATALRAKRLAGACLDVFAEEPLPAHSPLRSTPRVMLMPHASALSPNYLDLFLNEFIEQYRARYAAGRP